MSANIPENILPPCKQILSASPFRKSKPSSLRITGRLILSTPLGLCFEVKPVWQALVWYYGLTISCREFNIRTVVTDIVALQPLAELEAGVFGRG